MRKQTSCGGIGGAPEPINWRSGQSRVHTTHATPIATLRSSQPSTSVTGSVTPLPATAATSSVTTSMNTIAATSIAPRVEANVRPTAPKLPPAVSRWALRNATASRATARKASAAMRTRSRICAPSPIRKPAANTITATGSRCVSDRPARSELPRATPRNQANASTAMASTWSRCREPLQAPLSGSLTSAAQPNDQTCHVSDRSTRPTTCSATIDTSTPSSQRRSPGRSASLSRWENSAPAPSSTSTAAPEGTSPCAPTARGTKPATTISNSPSSSTTAPAATAPRASASSPASQRSAAVMTAAPRGAASG